MRLRARTPPFSRSFELALEPEVVDLADLEGLLAVVAAQAVHGARRDRAGQAHAGRLAAGVVARGDDPHAHAGGRFGKASVAWILGQQ